MGRAAGRVAGEIGKLALFAAYAVVWYGIRAAAFACVFLIAFPLMMIVSHTHQFFTLGPWITGGWDDDCF